MRDCTVLRGSGEAAAAHAALVSHGKSHGIGVESERQVEACPVEQMMEGF